MSENLIVESVMNTEGSNKVINTVQAFAALLADNETIKQAVQSEKISVDEVISVFEKEYKTIFER